jgi:hypothetical protein
MPSQNSTMSISDRTFRCQCSRRYAETGSLWHALALVPSTGGIPASTASQTGADCRFRPAIRPTGSLGHRALGRTALSQEAYEAFEAQSQRFLCPARRELFQGPSDDTTFSRADTSATLATRKKFLPA